MYDCGWGVCYQDDADYGCDLSEVGGDVVWYGSRSGLRDEDRLMGWVIERASDYIDTLAVLSATC